MHLCTQTYSYETGSLSLSNEKMLGLRQIIEFLGFTVDSNPMCASLPLEKVNHIRDVIRKVQKAAAISKTELLSCLLSGHLDVAMFVIPNLSESINLHDMVNLDAGCRSDLRFSSQLCEWNI